MIELNKSSFAIWFSSRLFNLRWCNTLTPRKWNPSTHWSTAGVRGRERREGRARGHKLWSPPRPLPPAGGFRYPVDFDFHENRALSSSQTTRSHVLSTRFSNQKHFIAFLKTRQIDFWQNKYHNSERKRERKKISFFLWNIISIIQCSRSFIIFRPSFLSFSLRDSL